MKIIKKILLILVIIVALVLIVAIFLPANVKVVRTIEINKPVEQVYLTLSTFQGRSSWDPWLETEPTANVTVSSDSGVGAFYEWDGEKLGAGKMTIKEVIPNRLIKSELTFLRPQTSSADVTWLLKPTATGTETSWVFESALGYPVERIMGLFFESMLGPDLERGLSNLKKVLEKS